MSRAQNAEARIKLALAIAHVSRVQRNINKARRAATDALSKARRLGYFNHVLAARLILAELDWDEKRRGAPSALAKLRDDAEQKGFRLIASKCSQLLAQQGAASQQLARVASR